MKKITILFVMALFWACDPCADVTCVNGTCVEGTCECDHGWTGSSCEVDMCASVTCDHGTCDAGVCICDNGWTGAFCSECLTDCGDHGACNDAGECACDNGWTGDLCDEEVVTTICTNTCEYADDGECDDGGVGSDWDLCACGTDCLDCGPRTSAECGTGVDAAISIWTSITTFPCNTQIIDVYFGATEADLEYYGYLDSYYSSQPECGDAGTVTMPVVHGTYYVYAECNDGDAYWGPGPVTVDEGYCYILELTASKSFSIVPKFLKNK